jgi:hypothetical protein
MVRYNFSLPILIFVAPIVVMLFQCKRKKGRGKGEKGGEREGRVVILVRIGLGQSKSGIL